MSKLPKLVEPRAGRITPEEDAATRFAGRGGLSEADATWIAQLILSPGVLPPPTTPTEPPSHIREYIISRLCEEFDRPDRDATMVLVLHFVTLTRMDGGGISADGKPWTMTPEASERYLAVLREHALPVQTAVMNLWPVLANPIELVQHLRARGMFDPIAALDIPLIKKYGDEPRPTVRNYADARFTHACCLGFWLRLLRSEALAGLPRLLEAETEEDECARLAQGIAKAVAEHALADLQLGYEWFADYAPAYLAAFRPIFDVLDGRLLRSQTPSPLLRRAWAKWGLLTFSAKKPEMPAGLFERLAAAATEELGRMRSLARRANEQGAAEEFESLFDVYTVSLHTLFRSDTVWRGMKPLLLLLRALTAPAVGPDLRYWHEQGLPATPAPWSRIAEDFVDFLHGRVRGEQLRDPELKAIRAEFSSFCLDRLKTREPKDREPNAPAGDASAMPMEDDPTWRKCFIRAIRELRINPRGRGHRVLHNCMLHDPDPEVRDAARIAYGELRHNPGLDTGMSARATIIAAHWWLRQAHRVHLGRDINTKGAQRTHDKERDLAKEVEQAQLAP